MTISDLILNPNELKNLNAASVRKAAKESFIPGVKNYSDKERGVLSAFCNTDFKMYDKEVGYFWKTLENAYKDLEQLQNTGVFVAEPDKRTKFPTDIVDACRECDKFYGIVMGKMKDSFNLIKGKWGTVDYYEIKSDSPLAKLVKDKSDERVMSLYNAREVVAYLATYLAVENGLVDNIVTSEKSKQDTLTYLFNGLVEPKNGGILNALKKYKNAYEGQKENMMDVFTIREIASELAKLSIESVKEEITSKIDLDVASNFYNCEMLEAIETMSPTEFKDIPLALDEGKSNYRVAFIDEKARRDFRENVRNYETADEAKKALDDNGARGTDLLAAIKYYDKQMLQDEKDKVVDTFEEGAWLCIANLLIVEFAGVEGKNKERLQQVFAIPLAQCLDRVESPEKRLEIVKKAIKKVDELHFESKIELTEEDSEAVDTGYVRLAAFAAARSSDKSAEVKAPSYPLKKYKTYMHEAMSGVLKDIKKEGKKQYYQYCPVTALMQAGLLPRMKKNGVVIEGNKQVEKDFKTFVQMKSEIEGTVASEKAQKKANKIAKNYNLSEEEQEVVEKVYGGLLEKEQQFKEAVEATGKKYNELSNAEKLELLEKIGLTQEEAEASIYDAYGKKKPTGDEVDAAR